MYLGGAHTSFTDGIEWKGEGGGGAGDRLVAEGDKNNASLYIKLF